MSPLIAVLALVTAVAAAARSTWSPCGLSMLSTITPVGERARGHRYRTTAVWFIAGSTLGGATLGGGAALLAAGVAALHVQAATRLWIAAAGGVLAGIADAGMVAHFPLLRRQVNERWLEQFRGWAYGVGFGWQIGVGVATYIMTAAVFLLVLLAALTASPAAALGLGIVFGLVRGLAVLLTRRATTPARLRDFHRRFDSFDGKVRAAVIGTEFAGALLASVAAWPPAAAAGVAGAAVYGLGRRRWHPADRLGTSP